MAASNTHSRFAYTHTLKVASLLKYVFVQTSRLLKSERKEKRRKEKRRKEKDRKRKRGRKAIIEREECVVVSQGLKSPGRGEQTGEGI